MPDSHHTPSITTSAGRHLGVDLLRGIAVLLVLGRHLSLTASCPKWMLPVVLPWHLGGWVGVDLFFVLSGFLVSGLLFQDFRKHGRIHVTRFYVRRGLKIYPSFYLLLAVTVAAIHWKEHLPIPTWAVIAEATFLQNYFGAFQWGNLWNHTWSLAVEEHFYLALPCLLTLFLWMFRGWKDPFWCVAPFCLVVCAALLWMRYSLLIGVSPADFHGRMYQVLLPTHLRIDSLLVGVAVSYFAHFHRETFGQFVRSQSVLLGICGAVLLAPAFLTVLERNPWLLSYGVTLFYIGSACLLCCVLGWNSRPNLLIRSLAGIGFYSYSIYLWHMPVKVWVTPVVEDYLGLPHSFVVDSGLYLVLAIVLGMAMAKLVELPALMLRDRWFPSPTTAAVASVADEHPLPDLVTAMAASPVPTPCVQAVPE